MAPKAWDQYVVECGLNAVKAALQRSPCELASEYASLMTSWLTHKAPSLPAYHPSVGASATKPRKMQHHDVYTHMHMMSQ